MPKVNPQDISIRGDLKRWRKNMGNIESLVASIQRLGQIQPIVVDREMRLVAGGRRLAACLVLQFTEMPNILIDYVFADTMNDITLREIELEENVQRKDFEPSEQVLAVQELHKLKQEIHGVASSDNAKDGWGLKETADIMGVSVNKVSRDLKLAKNIEEFPQLAECKTKNDIENGASAIVNSTDRAVRVEEYKKDSVMKDWTKNLSNMDAIEHMKTIEDKTIDILCVDPPFGINLDQIKWGKELKTEKNDLLYEDSPENIIPLYEKIAKESYRFCKGKSHGYVFLAISHFSKFSEVFKNEGWLVSAKPIIWTKNAGNCQCNMPSRWPASGYEAIMYIRRTDSELVRQGLADFISIPPILPSKKVHPVERPVELIKELLSRVCIPGQTVYDPCAGSFSMVEAALSLQLIPIANDIEEKCYNIGVDRVVNYMRGKK
ncbi:MAG TPA: hypothetical protein ENI76_10815 [Ignavibacteria bacterium]|nr:hypothetical protein [Ignavibacteria bacterium]